MTRAEFIKLLEDIQHSERVVSSQGQAEYAHAADNCFANFDSDADHGVSRLQSIATHLNKHMRGIRAFVNGHRSQREDIRGRIKDARLYLALLWGAIEDEERQAEAGLQNFLETRSQQPLLVVRSHEHIANPDEGWEYGADPLDEQMKLPYLTPQPLPVLRRADDIVYPDSH